MLLGYMFYASNNDKRGEPLLTVWLQPAFVYVCHMVTCSHWQCLLAMLGRLLSANHHVC